MLKNVGKYLVAALAVYGTGDAATDATAAPDIIETVSAVLSVIIFAAGSLIEILKKVRDIKREREIPVFRK